MATAAIFNLLFLSILVKCSISGGSRLPNCKISFIYVNRRLSYCCLCKNPKWRPPSSWIYHFCPFWSNGLFPAEAVYPAAKFHSFTSIGGWVIAVCAKIQHGGRRHLELQFCNAGPPTKSICAPEISLQISCWSSAYFSRYRDSKISQIWLKKPIQAPKNHVFGEFWPPNIIFYHRDPQKALPYAKTRVLSHKRSWSVFWCDL